MYLKYWNHFFAFVFFSAPIFASDWDYPLLLKKIEDKKMSGSISGIDFLYVINLDERPEKYALVKNQFAKFNIEPYRFSAVNGWKLSPSEVVKLGLPPLKKAPKNLQGTFYALDPETGVKEHHTYLAKVKRNCLCHCMSRGAIGIVLSHLSVIKDAYDSGFNRVWIMEDDIEILGNIKEKLPMIINEANSLVKKGWDILYTDIDTKANNGQLVAANGMTCRPDLMPMYRKRAFLLKRETLSDNLTLLGNRFGAYSYIINRSGMKKILRFFQKHHMFLPFDMELIYIDGLKQLSMRWELVSTRINSPSDNGGPNYENNS